MFTTYKKRGLILLSVIISALCILTGVILLLPYKAVTAENGNSGFAATVKFGNDLTQYCNSIADAMTYANGLATTENTPAVITMQSDAVTTDTLTVAAGKHVTLDLNGRILKYNNGNAKNPVITVLGNLTLVDSNPQAAHRYYRDNDNNGLWVFDEVNGTETLKGGVITGGTGNDEISEDESFGGGVYVGSIYDDDDNLISSGAFTMERGTIAGNTAFDGGGVYVDCGEFTMTGGAISGNVAEYDGIGGGGGVCLYGGEFTMTGGIISDNYTGGIGAGVAVLGEWSDEDNIFFGVFTMSGGEIIGNRAGLFVGGVSVINDGVFVMTDGAIIGNTGTYGVGGVGIFYGSFKMSGGTISGNMQTEDMGLGYYGGVCIGHPMFGDEVSITFEVSGAPIITGNKVTVDGNTIENNVVLSEGNTAKVVGALEAGGKKAQIGVYDTGVALTSDYSVYNKDANGDTVLASTYFIPDQSGYVPIVYGGEVRLDEGVATVTTGGEETAYADIETAWAAANGAQSAATVKMYDER